MTISSGLFLVCISSCHDRFKIPQILAMDTLVYSVLRSYDRLVTLLFINFIYMLYVIYTFKIWACPWILITADLLHLMECFIVQIYISLAATLRQAIPADRYMTMGDHDNYLQVSDNA